MHHQKIELWQHPHLFNTEKKTIENQTRIVVIITLVTMILEILFGWITHSMALLADGWHMGTHAFALGLSLFAFIMARKYAKDTRFTFGTWKIEILGAYTSAVVLGLVGMIMIFTSVDRFIHPLNINYTQALFVAVLGLLVNLICAVILKAGGHKHEHHHENEKHSHHSHEDLNLKSAYLHVIADAFTSILAIIALLGARTFQFNWLDPLMGIAGAVLIIRWSFYLLKDTGGILLEREMDEHIIGKIKNTIESDGDSKISDLHIWKVAQAKYACIISVVTAKKYSSKEYKTRLSKINELAHITIEINQCETKGVA